MFVGTRLAGKKTGCKTGWSKEVNVFILKFIPFTGIHRWLLFRRDETNDCKLLVFVLAIATSCPTGHTSSSPSLCPAGLPHKQAAVQQGGAGLQGTGEEVLPGGAAVATDTRGCHAVLPQTAVWGEFVQCRSEYSTCKCVYTSSRSPVSVFYQSDLPSIHLVPKSADEENWRFCD